MFFRCLKFAQNYASLHVHVYDFFFLLFQSLVNLFARLAHDNIGYIDWTPHISKVGHGKNTMS